MIDQKSLLNLKRITDFILINISFLVAAVFAQPIKELFSNELLFILLLLQNILWFITSNSLSTYSDFNYRSFSSQIITLSKLVVSEATFTIFFLFFVKEDLFTRNFVGIFILILYVAIIVKEFLIWSSLKHQREKGKGLRNLLVMGINSHSKLFSEQLEKDAELGFQFLGFIDDKNKSDEKLLGSIDNLEEVISDNDVSDVVYSLSVDNYELLAKTIRYCDKHAIKLCILPPLNQFSNSQIEFQLLGNFPVLRFRKNRLDEIQWRISKRLFDIIFTSILFVTVLWWVYLLIAIGIKITSRGKIFYMQKRVGRHSKEFDCYKFRTMKELNKEKQGIHDDSHRITSIGRFLRRYSIDEIPQFINVLKGDMSVVGPRPHPASYHKQYSEMVEEIKLRHRVKPGITGWAQIHGLRGDYQDFEQNRIWLKKRIDFDNWYIENWSVKLDIQIIIETI